MGWSWSGRVKKKRIVTPPDDELRGRDAPVWRNRGRESGIYWRRKGEMGRKRVKKENSSRSLEKSFSQVKEELSGSNSLDLIPQWRLGHDRTIKPSFYSSLCRISYTWGLFLLLYSLFFILSPLSPSHSPFYHNSMHPGQTRGTYSVFSIPRATGSSPIGNSIAIVQL